MRTNKTGSDHWRKSGIDERSFSQSARSLMCFCLLAAMIIVSGCRRYHTQQPEQDQAAPDREQKETLVRINKQLVDNDTKEIEKYIERNGYRMQASESGLRYAILRNGTGAKAEKGKVAELAFTLSLTDGTVCYSSDRSGLKTFRLGQGGVETGLEEGVLLMRKGDKARFIMPPYLAHGLSGDGDCIPPRAIIVYEAELLDLK